MILIIGILVAGVTQSSRLVQQMRLASARSQTESSPVASIRNLSFWLEPTLERSFLSSETENGASFTTWYDINPQSTSKNNFVKQAAANSNVQYFSNGINNLPAINFSGTASVYSALRANSLIPSGDVTFFIVYKSDDITSSTWRNMFALDDNNSGGWNFVKTTSTSQKAVSCSAVLNMTSGNFTTNPEIAVITITGSQFRHYTNGVEQAVSSSGVCTMLAHDSQPVLGGANNSPLYHNWDGLIAEVIYLKGF